MKFKKIRSLPYSILPDIVSKYNNLKADELTKIYFETIHKAIDKVKENNSSIYHKETLDLYDRYWNSRVLYFKICALVFKGPKFLYSLAHPFLNWLYVRALQRMDTFFRNLQEYSRDSSFYNKICTIESLLWEKRISSVLESN